MSNQTTLLRYTNSDVWPYMWIVLIILLIYYLRPWLKTIKLALSLPGPPAIPILGNISVVFDSLGMIKFGNSLYEKYGPLVRMWIFLRPTFIVLDPHDLQNVLGSTKNTNKNFLYVLLHNFIGRGLITNSGYSWKSHRKYMQIYFHKKILDTFVPTFATSSTLLVEKLRNKTHVNITSYINEAVLDILHEAVLGIPMKLNNGDRSHYSNDSPFRKGELVILQRFLKPWLMFDGIYKWSSISNNEEKQRHNLLSYTKLVMEKKQADIKNGIPSEQKNFLDMLLEILEDRPDFNQSDVINEACTFMLAGQDSVAAAISFNIYNLAAHPEIQDKVMKELDEIFQNSDRVATPEDIHRMKYLEQCIKETMRLYPSVPIIARNTSEDIKVGNVTIPAFSDIFITSYVTHRISRYYPDPEKYDPDRFTPEECEKRHPFAYLPFSAGPRNCIGYKFAYMEMKSVVSAILRNYKLSLAPGYKLVPSFRVTLRAKGGVWIQLEPRDSYKDRCALIL